MRLSEAIALGRVTLKAAANFLDDGESGCALGMAFRAVGGKSQGELGVQFDDIHREWSWLTNEIREKLCNCWYWQLHPGFFIGTYSQAIAHIFDAHVMQDLQAIGSEQHCEPWTMERLIDWVRSVEPQESPAEAEPATPAAAAMATR